ncbi:glycosyltransferase family 4 protein [Paenibacillus ginsengihumi]|uniref:glycosyltransferase family 4 protein n=1 Tax=Paenibacillus ginsengihumi TaxID=431596 RepID=UPI0003800E12|nr:glycosyltransferase family 4 protein [Paenibacillus ginsengihumi]
MTQIVWNGSIMDFTGYSKAAREYILGLHELGVDVKIEPDPNNLLSVELPAGEEQVLRTLMEKPEAGGRTVCISHDLPDYWETGADISIGFTYWETSRIPPKWTRKIQAVDAVFLPSRHNIDVFRQSGVQAPLFHIRPCLSRPNPASADAVPGYVAKLPPFRFLSVCSWIQRKGCDVLLQAFWEQFAGRDDVALVIKTVGSAKLGHEIDELKARLQAPADTAPVYVDTQIRSEAEMDALYRSCHAFVLPTRGEGVGYPMLDAAVRGLPIIATGWGGHLDFLDERNSFLVPYRLVPVPPQPYYYGYRSDQLWAEPSLDGLKRQMQHVLDHYEEAVAKGAMLQSYVEQHLTRRKAAEDIAAAVCRLTGLRLV